MARSVWPATKEKQTSREALAEVLMWAINDDTILGAAPYAGIVMARMAQRLMGNEWMINWLKFNKTELKKRIVINKTNFGKSSITKMFKKLFS